VPVARVSTVPYEHPFTYDILPGSESGTYFASGALIGSTLGGSVLSSGMTDQNQLSSGPPVCAAHSRARGVSIDTALR
jgi:hypothetical protein